MRYGTRRMLVGQYRPLDTILLTAEMPANEADMYTDPSGEWLTPYQNYT